MNETRKTAMYRRDAISDSIRDLERELETLKCELETQNRIIRAEDYEESSNEKS
jgi:hypothetical protein